MELNEEQFKALKRLGFSKIDTNDGKTIFMRFFDYAKNLVHQLDLREGSISFSVFKYYPEDMPLLWEEPKYFQTFEETLEFLKSLES